MCLQRVAAKMRVLVVFLSVVLGCSLAEGQRVGKCKLFDMLTAANDEQDAGKTLPKDILAKIVCHVEQGTQFDTSAVTTLSTSSTPPEVWTLYGLFQLSNHLVCHDNETPSPNICGIGCEKLMDDDISNDIDCLFNITGRLIDRGFTEGRRSELIEMVRLIFQDECRDKKAANYLAEC